RNRCVLGLETMPVGGNTALGPVCSLIASQAAVSRTLWLTQPFTESTMPTSSERASIVRSRDTFNPKSPLHDAGMRIEPPPWLAWATGAAREATATAAPPEEPPEDLAMSHGLRVGPLRKGSVVAVRPNSGVADLPSGTRPDASNASAYGD